jgi:hypothetical protein
MFTDFSRLDDRAMDMRMRITFYFSAFGKSDWKFKQMQERVWNVTEDYEILESNDNIILITKNSLTIFYW